MNGISISFLIEYGPAALLALGTLVCAIRGSLKRRRSRLSRRPGLSVKVHPLPYADLRGATVVRITAGSGKTQVA